MKRKETLNKKKQSSLTSVVTLSKQCNSAQIEPRRRNAFVSHKKSFKDLNTIEHQKLMQMKKMRRYAITDQSNGIPVNLKKAWMSVVIDKEEVEMEYLTPFFYSEKDSVKNDWLVVFNSDESLNIRYKGSIKFLSFINMRYRETYQFSELDAHRSIILAKVLHEMKSLGFVFIKLMGVSDSGGAAILNEDKALQMIQHRIDEVHSMYSILF